MSDKDAMTYIMVLSQHTFGGTERNHGTLYSGQLIPGPGFKPDTSECELNILVL